MSQIKGIDISNWQGNISDLGSDIDFVIIKATEGTGYVNPNLAEQVATARRDGKQVGFYHFSDVDDAAAEATHFANTVLPLVQHGDFFALDWETGNYSDAIDAWCANWITTAKAHLNTVALLYSNEARINAGSWTKTRATGAGLWMADWAATEGSPAPWPFAAIWQNSDAGSEQGVSGKVDTDIFAGDAQHLALYGYGGGASAPAPAQQPVVAPAPAPDQTKYVVKGGDNMSAVAVAHHMTLAQLEADNPQVKNPNLIYAGQVLNLSGEAVGAEYVTCEAGWGLEKIAEAAKLSNPDAASTWAAVAALNGSSNWQAFNADLKAGQKVRVR